MKPWIQMSSEHGSKKICSGSEKVGLSGQGPEERCREITTTTVQCHTAITDNIITSMVGVYIYIHTRIFAGCELCLWILYFQINKNRTFTGCAQHLVADLPEIFRRSTSGYPVRVEPTGRVRGSWHFLFMETRYVRCIEYLKHTMYTTIYMTYLHPTVEDCRY